MDYYLLTELTARVAYHLALSGAETFRIEETMRRIIGAYGIECQAFAIPNCVMVSLEAANGKPLMVMKRVGFHGNDLETMEKLNALSRRICAEKPPVEEFQQQLSTILAQPGEPRLHLAGSVLAAASFAVFFGGSLWDGVLAGGVAVFICWMERWLAPFCLNGVAFQFIASFLSGMAALLCCPELSMLPILCPCRNSGRTSPHQEAVSHTRGNTYLFHSFKLFFDYVSKST